MHDTTIPCASSKGDKVEVLSPCGSEINSDEAISLLTMRLEASMMSSKRLERDVEKVKEVNIQQLLCFISLYWATVVTQRMTMHCPTQIW